MTKTSVFFLCRLAQKSRSLVISLCSFTSNENTTIYCNALRITTMTVTRWRSVWNKRWFQRPLLSKWGTESWKWLWANSIYLHSSAFDREDTVCFASTWGANLQLAFWPKVDDARQTIFNENCSMLRWCMSASKAQLRKTWPPPLQLSMKTSTEMAPCFGKS